MKTNPNSSEIRHQYFSTLKQYRKKCKSRCRKFKTEILQKLDNLHGNNPTEYWKLVESLNLKSNTQNTDQISAESWNNHFRSLNVPDNNNHAEHVEILNKLVEMGKIPTYNNLDNIITDKESVSIH